MRWFLVLAMLGIASPAQAVTVTNLSDSPQVLMIEQYGRQWQAVIQPKQAYRYFGGTVNMNVPGRPTVLNAEPYDFYTIWPDGALYIQKRNSNRNMAH